MEGGCFDYNLLKLCTALKWYQEPFINKQFIIKYLICFLTWILPNVCSIRIISPGEFIDNLFKLDKNIREFIFFNENSPEGIRGKAKSQLSNYKLTVWRFLQGNVTNLIHLSPSPGSLSTVYWSLFTEKKVDPIAQTPGSSLPGKGPLFLTYFLLIRGLCKTRDFGQSQSLSDFKTSRKLSGRIWTKARFCKVL